MTTSKWMHAGTILKMNAYHYPDKLGWQDKFKEFSFKEWNERACRLANGLKDLGVSHQETFAVHPFEAKMTVIRQTPFPISRDPHSVNPLKDFIHEEISETDELPPL